MKNFLRFVKREREMRTSAVDGEGVLAICGKNGRSREFLGQKQQNPSKFVQLAQV